MSHRTPVQVRFESCTYEPTEDGDREIRDSHAWLGEFEHGQELLAHLGGEGIEHPSCSPLPSSCELVWLSREPEQDFCTGEYTTVTASIAPDANAETVMAWNYAVEALQQ